MYECLWRRGQTLPGGSFRPRRLPRKISRDNAKKKTKQKSPHLNSRVDDRHLLGQATATAWHFTLRFYTLILNQVVCHRWAGNGFFSAVKDSPGRASWTVNCTSLWCALKGKLSWVVVEENVERFRSWLHHISIAFGLNETKLLNNL